MIKKLKLEKNLLLSIAIVCLIAIIMSRLSEKRTYEENKRLNYENWWLTLENRRLNSDNEYYTIENDILLRRLNEYEQSELEKQSVIYDIPLSEELQQYTYDLCKESGLDYKLVLAIMGQESSYKENIISSTNDFGMMQINIVNHDWLAEALNINDFLDAKQNIVAGLYLLMDLTSRYDNPHQVLMAYNMGEYNAQKKWDKGVLTSKYSRQVIEIANELKEE